MTDITNDNCGGAAEQENRSAGAEEAPETVQTPENGENEPRAVRDDAEEKSREAQEAQESREEPEDTSGQAYGPAAWEEDTIDGPEPETAAGKPEKGVIKDKKSKKDKKDKKDNTGKKDPVREVASWVFTLSLAVIIALLIRSFVFIIVQVDGSSMRDTLHDENRLFVWRAGYIFDSPQRGDIVICELEINGAPKVCVKRAIGLPGETISISKGYVYINGEKLEEPYISENRRKIEDMQPRTLGEDEYFVMGDNRINSTDSRYVGPLKRDDILGKAVFKVWPFDEMGQIEE